MKLALRIAAIIGILLIAIEATSYFYRRANSESIALSDLRAYCREQGFDLSKLSGPTSRGVGDSPVSYSWAYRDSSHHLELLVTFDYFYNDKIAIWDFNRRD